MHYNFGVNTRHISSFRMEISVLDLNKYNIYSLSYDDKLVLILKEWSFPSRPTCIASTSSVSIELTRPFAQELLWWSNLWLLHWDYFFHNSIIATPCFFSVTPYIFYTFPSQVFDDLVVYWWNNFNFMYSRSP